jgi:DNA/RNA-binding domain of Phe-tRNA-synthetase-like protein
MTEARFRYDDAVAGRYPAIRAGVVHVAGTMNGPSSKELLHEYETQQSDTARLLAATPIAEIRSIVAWRRAFTAFGAKPTQHRNAAEALLRRLEKHGDIPTISMLVDIGNLVSIRHALPIAVIDLTTAPPPITVRFSKGTESFDDLGSSESTHPEPGEVVFVDAVGAVAARRWCWRQSRHSATGLATTEALIVAEALHENASADVTAAADDLLDLLRRHQPQAPLAATFHGPGSTAHD